MTRSDILRVMAVLADVASTHLPRVLVLVVLSTLLSSARAQDDCREHVALDPPASERTLSLADLEPEPAPVEDPVPLQQLTRSMASRGLRDDELAAWLHRVVEAHFALERYWARRAREAPDDARAARERDEERAAGAAAAARLAESFPTYRGLEDVMFEVASALVRAGEPTRAASTYRRVVERRGRSPLAAVARMRLAELALAGGDVEAAREQLAAVMAAAEGPLSGLAAYELAWIERRAGRHARSLALFERAAETGPATVRERALVELAPAYVSARRAAGAIAFVRRVARIDEERVALVRALVAAYQAASQADVAMALARRAQAASIGHACAWAAVVERIRIGRSR